MGQSFKKMGNEENKISEIETIIEKCYEKYFENQIFECLPDFYHAVCQAVEDINKKIGSTSFRVPKTTTLKEAYNKHHKRGEKNLTKEEFQRILQDIIMDTGVTGIGAKDVFFYMFGVPSTAQIIKQMLIPKAIPNELFIPVVTSVTVFLLAKLNKI
ncbi:uncharacterized protein LOC111365752 [Olea europaea var. sylvestris]|uniref:uncharacterized protein LOC111365752 n=1 Tax=Olea europaea var. sylvestris TaxID=158386 RepID=UPI000C1D8719|nr:uncharacterized protein LOC111365752 [Olea europaea var. sylvestris]